MQNKKVTRWRPGGRLFVLAALAAMCGSAMATPAPFEVDWDPLVEGFRDGLAGFFTSTGVTIMSIILIMVTIALVIKFAKRAKST